MNYEILATGSSGNAVIINSHTLIDCGVPLKKLRPYLQELRLVLLTHEHGDHFRESTVKALARERPALRWGCCEWMVPHLLAAGVAATQIDVLRPEVWAAYPGPLYVCPVRLRHNVPNCGYRLDDGESRMLYATDTGSLEDVRAVGYDLYLVEANHTEADLEERRRRKEKAGEFAYETAAAENHLSYEQATAWLMENMREGSYWVPMHGHVDRGGGESDAEPDT